MLFDTHVHTSESSSCGQISGADIAKMYKKAGYDGIVITDHFVPYYFYDLYKGIEWEALAERQEKGYLAAKAEGDEIGITVLYGCELRFDGNSNDYLVYGMPNSFLRENPDIFSWGINKFSKFAAQNGFLVFQAHPFRNDMMIVDPSCLYGVEVYNGKPIKDLYERNAFANLWADRYGLRKIAGSDCHNEEQLARAGVNFFKSVNSMEQFTAQIDAGNYMLVERAGTHPSGLSDFDN